MDANNRIVLANPWWRRRAVWVCLGLLIAYGLAIFLDLPTPAGTRYLQDLPPKVLQQWGVHFQLGQPAPHWWDKTQALRGWSVFPEGWAWPKLVPAPLAHWLLLLGLGLIGALGLHWLERRMAQPSRWVTLLALAALIVLAYVLQLATLWLKAPDVQDLLLNRVTDADFTGFFSSALQINHVSAFFGAFDRTLLSPAYCDHCRTHPPGPVLYYWIFLHAVSRLPLRWQQTAAEMLLSVGGLPPPNLPPAAMVVALVSAHTILLVAALIVIPLYGLAKRLASPELALPLAALGAVLPGLVLMSPEFDQLYATLTAILLYLAVRGLDAGRSHAWWGLGTGVFFAFCLYWSFGLWVLLLPIGFLALAAMTVGLGTRSTRSVNGTASLSFLAVAQWLLGLAIGIAVPWGLLQSLTGFQILNVLRETGRAHLGGITAVRPYGPWLVFNLVDYLQFAGLPLIVATGLTLAWRRSPAASMTPEKSKTTESWPATFRRSIELNIYGLLFWGMLVALDLSGTTRAEVARLWIFLTPLALMGIYHAVGRRRLTVEHVYVLLATQFVACLLIGGNWLTP